MKEMHNKKISFFLPISVLIILLWLSACSPLQQEESVTPTESNNIFATPQIMPSATSTAGQPQIIFTKTLTSIPQPKAICPILNSKTTIAGGETVFEIEQAILDYLNQGGSPEQLQTEIKKLQDTSIVGPTQVIKVDTNGDDIQEIVLAINFGPPKVSGDYMDVHGNVHIYDCADHKYNDTEIVEGYFADTQTILAVENLLGSDAPEILISRRYTYLDIYFEAVEMYMLKEEGWMLSFNTSESQCAVQTDLKDGSNGYKELIIVEGTGCSPSIYNPFRSRKSTYEFRDNEVELIHDEWLPSPFRIHRLEDAATAIAKGDLVSAIELYDKARRNNNLMDALTMNEEYAVTSQNMTLEEIQQTAHAYQTGFAYFREFVLLYYLNRNEEAENLFHQMKIQYLEGESGSELVDLAAYFLDQIKSGVSVKQACEVTNRYLVSKYMEDTNYFVSEHLEYRNIFWPQTEELICPIVTSP